MSRTTSPRTGSSLVLAWGAPLAVGAALLAGWETVVRVRDIPKYQLAPPSLIAETIVRQWPDLSSAWWVTTQTMLAALAAAVVLGVLMAAAFASSRLIETSLFPYAVALQVTPLVAVAPFIVLWVGLERVWLTQLVCAWIVAFFPILSNTTLGLRSAEPGLRDLFHLYNASRWQTLRWLLAPAALPYFLAGLRVSANLALVGAVVAEFVIGPEVDRPGLASTILNAQLAQDTPTMFAALTLVSITGIAAYFATHALSRLLLGGWHAAALSAPE
ncbi:MAG TPA: ABC transporter permease [Lacipirellulaceae bacterium]|nr:ABC transporter permease [Lacipirellulaceae bacterium]HMP06360.1 ABC transporter permease [Lacipirellulaceae bacterium]